MCYCSSKWAKTKNRKFLWVCTRARARVEQEWGQEKATLSDQDRARQKQDHYKIVLKQTKIRTLYKPQQ